MQGLLFAESGEGTLCPRLDFRRFEDLGVWNRVHAGDVQVATVICSLASIRRDERRHPASVRVAQRFTFLGAVGEEIHTWKKRNHRKEKGKDKEFQMYPTRPAIWSGGKSGNAVVINEDI